MRYPGLSRIVRISVGLSVHDADRDINKRPFRATQPASVGTIRYVQTDFRCENLLYDGRAGILYVLHHNRCAINVMYINIYGYNTRTWTI